MKCLIIKETEKLSARSQLIKSSLQKMGVVVIEKKLDKVQGHKFNFAIVDEEFANEN